MLLPSAAAAAAEEPSPYGLEEVWAPVAADTTKARNQKRPKVNFKVGDWKLKKVRWKDLRFNGGEPLAIETEGPQDDQAIPMRPLGAGGSLVYNLSLIHI